MENIRIGDAEIDSTPKEEIKEELNGTKVVLEVHLIYFLNIEADPRWKCHTML